MKVGMACVALGLIAWGVAHLGAVPVVLFQDDFSTEKLDVGKWTHTSLNDFQTELVNIRDGRLYMGAATIGTDDSTVKFHGVRTTEPIVDLTRRVEISFDLDWNDQPNGCYMTVGAYLCPTRCDNPRDEPDGLSLLYIGVPPGHNGRCAIKLTRAGRERDLLTEDWPAKREGRKLGLQRVRIILDRGRMTIRENGRVICEAADLAFDFDKAYLYLQHSSHSNYRLRETYFDNVLVRR